MTLSAEAKPVTMTVKELMDGNTGQFGAGLMLGNPTGLSMALRKKDISAFQGGLGWSFREDKIHITADYIHNMVILKSESKPAMKYPIYLGIGAKLLHYARISYTQLGLRFPVGLSLLPGRVPVDAFIEFSPTMYLYPDSILGMDFAIGGRYYF